MEHLETNLFLVPTFEKPFQINLYSREHPTSTFSLNSKRKCEKFSYQKMKVFIHHSRCIFIFQTFCLIQKTKNANKKFSLSVGLMYQVNRIRFPILLRGNWPFHLQVRPTDSGRSPFICLLIYPIFFSVPNGRTGISEPGGYLEGRDPSLTRF